MHITRCKYNSFLFAESLIKFFILYKQSYKQTWKAANNHFQRYSDVKPREERRPTVMDLANQACVLQKVNGWKIFHLNSQMEDLVWFERANWKKNRNYINYFIFIQAELESQVYDKLSTMLQCMEAHNQRTDVDRVNDLIKVSIYLLM